MRERWAGNAADEAVPILQAEVRALRLDFDRLDDDDHRKRLKHAQAAIDNAEAEVRRLRDELKAERDATAVMWGCDVSALKKSSDAVLKAWGDYTSQEMYGEMLRDGMDAVDFDNWEEAHDSLRAARGES